MSTGSREWGPWSVWKTELVLGAYLPSFVQAAGGAPHRTFIDCFAGSVNNRERYTDREIQSSCSMAFEVNPEFTHLLLFELENQAEALRADLAAKYPDRTFEVIPGDCNTTIRRGLKWWRTQGTAYSGPHLGPALAYLDPNNHSQLSWSTVEAIATFARDRLSNSAHRRKRPPELLILLPTGTMRRTLPTAPGSQFASATDVKRVIRLFGTNQWLHIYHDQRKGVLTGDAGWRQYAELYRLRLQALGYEHVTAIETRNTKNAVVYHLIFASNHFAGASIMRSVMEQASRLLPEKLTADRERAKRNGQQSLFGELHEEMELIAHSPESYALLMTDPPQPYVAGSGSEVAVTRPSAVGAGKGRENGPLGYEQLRFFD